MKALLDKDGWLVIECESHTERFALEHTHGNALNYEACDKCESKTPKLIIKLCDDLEV